MSLDQLSVDHTTARQSAQPETDPVHEDTIKLERMYTKFDTWLYSKGEIMEVDD